MSRTVKIILIVGGILLLLCVIAGVVGSLALRQVGEQLQTSFTDNAADVSKLATEIADFDVLSDLKPEFGMKLLNFTFVGYTANGDSNTHLFLMQFPKGLAADQGEMERQMRENLKGRLGDESLNFAQVGTRTVNIRGSEVTVSVLESSGDNQNYRQLTGVFDGKSGPTLLVLTLPTSQWDDAAVDQFLQSIR